MFTLNGLLSGRYSVTIFQCNDAHNTETMACSISNFTLGDAESKAVGETARV